MNYPVDMDDRAREIHENSRNKGFYENREFLEADGVKDGWECAENVSLFLEKN